MSEWTPDPSLLRIARTTAGSRRRGSGTVLGRRASLLRGEIGEFADYRPYSYGDDPRRIDWKSWGRSEKLFVRRHEQESDLPIYLLLDASRSMGLPSSRRGKFDRARDVAAACALHALLLGEEVRLGAFTHTLGRLRRATTFESACRILGELLLHERADFDKSLAMLDVRLPATCRVVILSDFLGPTGNLSTALRKPARGGRRIIAAQFLDPVEIDFPFVHTVRFRGLEGEAPIDFDGEVLRGSYLDQLNGHQERLRIACRRSGVGLSVFDTTADAGKLLRRILSR